MSPIIKMTFCSAVAAVAALALTSCDSKTDLTFSPEKIAGGQQQSFPPVALRGYGTVSGEDWSAGEGRSILQISCEDEAHAKLLQAKYLSDLSLLPGVSEGQVTVRGVTVQAQQAVDQGYIAAIRKGNTVFIAAAQDRGGFEKLLQDGFQGSFSTASSRAEVEVPMWLDRWDKFGFRFYYRPLERPTDREAAKTYDITTEFDFAKSLGVGLNFWASSNWVTSADGLTNETLWDWAAEGANEARLPVGLQLSGAPQGSAPWLLNRFRDESAMLMPQFVGFYRPADYTENTGWLSNVAQKGFDVQNGLLQDIIRRVRAGGNMTTVLEPHGEISRGIHKIFHEYGPVADASYQKFLRERYTDLSKLNAAWGTSFTDWSEARVPELASFAGWGEGAVDLRGPWKIRYEDLADGGAKTPGELLALGKQAKPATKPAPAEWYAEGFDDSLWPELTAPGHFRSTFLPQRPMVLRRHFSVPPGWLKDGQRVWLYVWDLVARSADSDNTIRVDVNGKTVGKDVMDSSGELHWNAYDVTNLLREQGNLLALRLPKARIDYRVYLSTVEPKQYPDLGPTQNARWVDFSDWKTWYHGETQRRGMEMIRQVAPDEQISLMAPNSFIDAIKQIAVDYGGNFHNTGYMGAFWADDLPSYMRGAQLPFSLEPGGPAKDLPGLKKQLGLWSTEGIQGIDYFIHIGSIMWNPELRKHFEDEIAVTKLIGKTHAPRTEVAALYSDRNQMLTGFPWKTDGVNNLGSGYWKWNVRTLIRESFESDALTESSFATGDAARYKVIFDTNTTVMDEKLVQEIEEYVKNGGVFVTLAQTGRHTSTGKDAWPIQRLTGYRVTDVGRPEWRPRNLKAAAGNPPLSAEWIKAAGPKGLDGMKLQRVADDAQDVAVWEDGSVAVGMRPLGKGYIIQLGARFGESEIGDRPTVRGQDNGLKALYELMKQICEWRGVEPIPAKVHPEYSTVLFRHYVSNNGLYDVWFCWNESPNKPFTGEVKFTGIDPKWAFEARDSKRLEIVNRSLPLALEPLQTRAFLTPRNTITAAAPEWFTLQRNWWRKPKPVSDTPLPRVAWDLTLDLGQDWAFKPVAEGEDAAKLCAVDVDDASWERMRLGIWNLPNHRDVRRAVFRKQFTVPATWTDGDIGLWLTSFGSFFLDQGRIWIDGKPISEQMDKNGVADVNPGGVFKPGSTHVIAVEIESKGSLGGTRGTAWLRYWPKPAAQQSLAGQWSVTAPGDPITPAGEVTLPGNATGMILQRNVVIPEEQRNRRVVVNVDADVKAGVEAVMINGQLLSESKRLVSDRWQIDVTPWVRFGQENEIELVSVGSSAPIRDVSLYFFDPPTN